MKISRLLALGSIVLLLAWGAACSPGAPPTTVIPPGTSVVLITIDTLRADHLSLNGHPHVTTPYLDRLAREGVYCSRCYAQSSWTLPSMLSMFSSLTPAVFGVTRGVAPLDKHLKQGPLHEEEVQIEYFSSSYETLTEVLASHGYATAGFSTNGHLRVEQGFAQGFAHFDQESCVWDTAECVFVEARDWLDEYVAQPREGPFFLWVHLFDPHFDKRRDGDHDYPLYATSGTYANLFSESAKPTDSIEEKVRRSYDRKLRLTDDQIANFVENLRERGLLDHSILALAADHGEEFNEKGRWGHSKSLDNTLVHVPLLFRFPGESPRGVVDVPVRNMDLAPTLLGALGIPAPAAMRGVSLMPLFEGRDQMMPASYGETRRFGFDYRFRIDPALDRKLVLDMNSGQRWLYDLTNDPGEIRDLSKVEPTTADALEHALRTDIQEMESRGHHTQRMDTMSQEEIEHLKTLGYL
ncbi:sulfatase [Myxococcota bacterium]|nr:sulfatase [Myxococcota bacterium]